MSGLPPPRAARMTKKAAPRGVRNGFPCLASLAPLDYFLSSGKRRVAQLGRARAWGARGRWFKSSRADQIPTPVFP